MQRFILIIVATFVFMAVPATAAAAAAAADMWRVSQKSGDVRVIHHRLQPAAARIDAALSPGDLVMTGATGRATLTRGGDYIVIAPSSRLLLPANSQHKGMTSLIQEIGTMLFKVRSTGKPHFRVDTPMLAAVVKGTTFTVIVGVDRSAVQVIEGAVQVSAVQGGMSQLVEGGKTVFIANDNPTSLVVADGATLQKTSGSSDISVKLGGSGDTDLATVANLSAGLVRADLTAAAVKPVVNTSTPIADTVQSPIAGSVSVADVLENATGAPVITAVVSGVATAVPVLTSATAPIVSSVVSVVPVVTSAATAVLAPTIQAVAPIATVSIAPIIAIAPTVPTVTIAPIVPIVPIITIAPTAPVITIAPTVPIVPIAPIIPILPAVPCLGCP